MRQEEKIELSVVIPAYNEEKRIQATLTRVKEYLRVSGCSYEIIVVDDGSKDNTAIMVKAFCRDKGRVSLLTNAENKGKGYSVKKGVMQAGGSLILFLDADLATPIEEVEKIFPWFERGYDVVIGSRALPNSNIVVHQPWYRETMGRIFNLLVRFLVLKGIKDTQCGFKCFKNNVAHVVFSNMTLTRFSFDVEVLYITKKFGYRIREVPVNWYDSGRSSVHIFSDSTRMLWDIVNIRFKKKT
jgi:dolichyl-phosphate beta-glucosyltransferase